MSTVREVNFDGLIGPTHNYAGLSLGNVASQANAGEASNPKAAALQSLSKMRLLIDLGLVQGFLPPLPRPNFKALYALGFGADERTAIERAWRCDPAIVATVYSASSMWTANAATVAPSTDTKDARVHFVPANLASNLHRQFEGSQTAQLLQQVFADPDHFRHHPPLPGGVFFSDEGAANHGRLAPSHAEPGLHVFVYGDDGARYPARQSRAASAAVARSLELNDQRVLLLKQSPAAIDAGAFHNDVVGVANENVLFLHEQSFADRDLALARVKECAPGVEIIEAPSREMPLEDAIASYLFNSQLVTLGDGKMALILPVEARENQCANDFLKRVLEDDNSVAALNFIDVRESMRNGGGPACLRLRVVLNGAEQAAVSPLFITDPDGIERLEAWVARHYRDRLVADDLRDPDFAREALDAVSTLYGMLGVRLPN